MNYIASLCEQIESQILSKYLFGHNQLLRHILIAFFNRGHILIEGPPGTAKTMTAKLMAHVLAKSFKRIQFTTDLLPGDILGAHFFSPQTQEFKFIPGPIFADFILADEINRTPPRTQSAMLEAMEERQVTIEGQLHKLSDDFFVIATQNPFDFEGTFPLPEVQLDRFLFKVVVEHATAETETSVLKHFLKSELPPKWESIPTIPVDRRQIQDELNAIVVDESILRYLTELLSFTRKHPMLASGSSLRGGIALIHACKVLAAMENRNFVSPDDVKSLAIPALRHRIKLNPEAQVANVNDETILKEILTQVSFPK